MTDAKTMTLVGAVFFLLGAPAGLIIGGSLGESGQRHADARKYCPIILALVETPADSLAVVNKFNECVAYLERK